MFRTLTGPFVPVIDDGYEHRSERPGAPPRGLPMSAGHANLPSWFPGEPRSPYDPLPPGVVRGPTGAVRYTGEAFPVEHRDFSGAFARLQDAAGVDDEDDVDTDAAPAPASARAARAAVAQGLRDNAQADLYTAGIVRSGHAHAQATDVRASCAGCRRSLAGSFCVSCSDCDLHGPELFCASCDTAQHLVHWSHERRLFIARSAKLDAQSLSLDGASLGAGVFVRQSPSVDHSSSDVQPVLGHVEMYQLPVALPVAPLDDCAVCGCSARWRVNGGALLNELLNGHASKQRIMVVTHRSVVQVTVPPAAALFCGGHVACSSNGCPNFGDLRCPSHSVICGAALPRDIVPVDDVDVLRFFPSTTVDPRLFVDVDVLYSWRALFHASPGTSTEGFSRFLSLRQRALDDAAALLPDMPRDASLASIFSNWCRNHDINDILRAIEAHNCPSCGVHDAGVSAYSVAHIDGNAKLYSFKRTPGQTSQALNYHSSLHLADDLVSRHWDSLRAHKPTEKEDDSGCSSAFAATKMSKFATLNESGALIATCAHCHIIRWANLYGGEKYMFAEGLAHHGLDMRGKTPQYISYDIGCRWFPSVSRLHESACKRGPIDAPAEALDIGDAALDDGGARDEAFCSCFDAHGVAGEAFKRRCDTYNIMLGMLHNKAHGLSCQLRYAPTLFRGAGWLTCETTEQVNAFLSRLGNAVKHLRPDTRIACIDRFASLFNVSKQEQAPATLYRQLCQAVDRVLALQEDFDGILTRLNAVATESGPYSPEKADALLTEQRRERGLGKEPPQAPVAADTFATGGRNSKATELAELLEIEATLALARSLRGVLDNLAHTFYMTQASAAAKAAVQASAAADTIILRSVMASHSATMARLAALSQQVPALLLRRSRIRATLQRPPYNMTEEELNRQAGTAAADESICDMVAEISRHVQRQGDLMALRDDTRGSGSRVHKAVEQLKGLAKRIMSMRGSWATFMRFASPDVQRLAPPSVDHLLKMRNVEEFARALRATLTAAAPATAAAAAAVGAGGAAVGAVPAGLSDAMKMVMSRVTEGLAMELVRSRAAVLSAREELGNIVRALEHNITYYDSDRAAASSSGLAAIDAPPPASSATAATPPVPLPAGDVAGAFARDLSPARLVTSTLASLATRPPCRMDATAAVAYGRVGLRLRLVEGLRRSARLAAESRKYHEQADAYLSHRVGVGADAAALDERVGQHGPWRIEPASDKLRQQARDPNARANAQAMLERALKLGAIPSAVIGDGAGDVDALDDVCERALGEVLAGMRDGSS